MFIGEKPDDLQPFDANQFAQALFEDGSDGHRFSVDLKFGRC
jgi:hypothetical protein